MEFTQILLSESFEEAAFQIEKVPVATLEIEGIYHTIYNTENTIGRVDDNNIVIQNNAVSSKHAVIEADDPNSHLLYDLGSTNKTKLGKLTLKPHVRYIINDGDNITFGNVSAIYNISKQLPGTPVKGSQGTVPETPEKEEHPNVIPESPEPNEDVESVLDKSDMDIFDEKRLDTSTPCKTIAVVDETGKKDNSDDIYELDTLSFEDVEILKQHMSEEKPDSLCKVQNIEENDMKIIGDSDEEAESIYNLQTEKFEEGTMYHETNCQVQKQNIEPNSSKVAVEIHLETDSLYENNTKIDSQINIGKTAIANLNKTEDNNSCIVKNEKDIKLSEINSVTNTTSDSLNENKLTSVETEWKNIPTSDEGDHTACDISKSDHLGLKCDQPLDEDFFIPSSQNVDMFETEGNEMNTSINDDIDNFSESGDESILGLSTQQIKADLSESMVLLKDNEDLDFQYPSVISNVLLEPASQPIGNARLSLKNISVTKIDETLSSNVSSNIFESSVQSVVEDKNVKIKNNLVPELLPTNSFINMKNSNDSIEVNIDSVKIKSQNLSFNEEIYEAETQPFIDKIENPLKNIGYSGMIEDASKKEAEFKELSNKIFKIPNKVNPPDSVLTEDLNKTETQPFKLVNDKNILSGNCPDEYLDDSIIKLSDMTFTQGFYEAETQPFVVESKLDVHKIDGKLQESVASKPTEGMEEDIEESLSLNTVTSNTIQPKNNELSIKEIETLKSVVRKATENIDCPKNQVLDESLSVYEAATQPFNIDPSNVPSKDTSKETTDSDMKELTVKETELFKESEIKISDTMDSDIYEAPTQPFVFEKKILFEEINDVNAFKEPSDIEVANNQTLDRSLNFYEAATQPFVSEPSNDTTKQTSIKEVETLIENKVVSEQIDDVNVIKKILDIEKVNQEILDESPNLLEAATQPFNSESSKDKTKLTDDSNTKEPTVKETEILKEDNISDRTTQDIYKSPTQSIVIENKIASKVIDDVNAFKTPTDIEEANNQTLDRSLNFYEAATQPFVSEPSNDITKQTKESCTQEVETVIENKVVSEQIDDVNIIKKILDIEKGNHQTLDESLNLLEAATQPFNSESSKDNAKLTDDSYTKVPTVKETELVEEDNISVRTARDIFKAPTQPFVIENKIASKVIDDVNAFKEPSDIEEANNQTLDRSLNIYEAATQPFVSEPLNDITKEIYDSNTLEPSVKETELVEGDKISDTTAEDIYEAQTQLFVNEKMSKVINDVHTSKEPDDDEANNQTLDRSLNFYEAATQPFVSEPSNDITKQTKESCTQEVEIVIENKVVSEQIDDVNVIKKILDIEKDNHQISDESLNLLEAATQPFNSESSKDKAKLTDDSYTKESTELSKEDKISDRTADNIYEVQTQPFFIEKTSKVINDVHSLKERYNIDEANSHALDRSSNFYEAATQPYVPSNDTTKQINDYNPKESSLKETETVIENKMASGKINDDKAIKKLPDIKKENHESLNLFDADTQPLDSEPLRETAKIANDSNTKESILKETVNENKIKISNTKPQDTFEAGTQSYVDKNKMVSEKIKDNHVIKKLVDTENKNKLTLDESLNFFEPAAQSFNISENTSEGKNISIEKDESVGPKCPENVLKEDGHTELDRPLNFYEAITEPFDDQSENSPKPSCSKISYVPSISKTSDISDEKLINTIQNNKKINIYELDTEPLVADGRHIPLSKSNESKNNNIPTVAEVNIYELDTEPGFADTIKNIDSKLPDTREVTMNLSDSVFEVGGVSNNPKVVSSKVLSNVTDCTFKDTVDMSISCANLHDVLIQNVPVQDENGIKEVTVGLNNESIKEKQQEARELKTNENPSMNETSTCTNKPVEETQDILRNIEKNINIFEIKITKNKPSDVFDSSKKNSQNNESLDSINSQGSSLTLTTSSNRNKKFIFPDDSPVESSQELNLKFKTKGCNIFPADTEEYSESSESLAKDKNKIPEKERLKKSSDKQNVTDEIEQSSEELNVKFKKKGCAIFPADTQDLNEDSSSKIDVSATTDSKAQISMRKSVRNRIKKSVKNINEIEESSEEINIKVNKKDVNVFPPDTQDLEPGLTNIENSKKINKSIRKTPLKKSATDSEKESDTDTPKKSCGRLSFIARGEINLHSDEDTDELDKVFQRVTADMSPSKLSVDSDSDSDEGGEAEVPDVTVRRSERKRKVVYQPLTESIKELTPEVQTKKKKNETNKGITKLKTRSSKTGILKEHDNEDIKETKEENESVSERKLTRSVKKFQKASPSTSEVKTSIKNVPTQKDITLLKKRESYDSQNDSQSSLSNLDDSEGFDLGRGKRKRVKTSFDGFVVHDDLKKSRKKFGDSPTPDFQLKKSQNSADEKQSSAMIKNSQPSSSGNLTQAVSVILHDINKKSSQTNPSVRSPVSLLIDDNNDDDLILPPPTKKNISLKLNKTKSISSPKTEMKSSQNFSFCDKLDELFDIWGPADTVKLSPRAAKKPLKVRENEEIIGISNKKGNNSQKNSKNKIKEAKVVQKKKPAVEEEIVSIETKTKKTSNTSNKNIKENNNKDTKKQLSPKHKIDDEPSEVPVEKRRRRKTSNSDTNSVISLKGEKTVVKRMANKNTSTDSKTDGCTTNENMEIEQTSNVLPKKKMVSKENSSTINKCAVLPSTRNEDNTAKKGGSKKIKVKASSDNDKISNTLQLSSPSTSYPDCYVMSQEFSFHEKALKKHSPVDDRFKPPQVAIRRSSRSKNTEKKSDLKKAEKVLFSGFPDRKLSPFVTNLGGEVVTCPFTCTVLVTDEVKRTTKFLCAVGRGIPIVTQEWIHDSNKTGRFSDMEKFIVCDKEAEKQYSFKLNESLKKATSKKLLDGWSIFVTSTVKPPPEEIKSIIECSGGKYLSKEPARWTTNSLIISCEGDKPEWNKLKKRGKTPPIVKTEALFSGILQQNLDIESYRLI